MNDKGKVRYVFGIRSDSDDGLWVSNLLKYTQISDIIEVEEAQWLLDESKTFDTREEAWDYALECISRLKGRQV